MAESEDQVEAEAEPAGEAKAGRAEAGGLEVGLDGTGRLAPREKPKKRDFVQFSDPAKARRNLFFLAALVLFLTAPNWPIPLLKDLVGRMEIRSMDALMMVNDEFRRLVDPYPTPPRDVVVIAIDEGSLARHGRWPWNRSKVADLITGLKDLGVHTTAVDVLFAEPQYSPLEGLGEVLDRLPEAVRERVRWLDDLVQLEAVLEGLPPDLRADPAVEELRKRLLPPWEDELLVRAVRDAGNVVLGVIMERKADRGGSLRWLGTPKSDHPPPNAVAFLEQRAAAGELEDVDPAELEELWDADLFADVFLSDGRPFPLVQVGTFNGESLVERARAEGLGWSGAQLVPGLQYSFELASEDSEFSGMALPLPRLLAAAEGVGYMNDQGTDDAVVRRFPVLGRFEQYGVPSLVLAALEHYVSGRAEIELEGSTSERTATAIRLVRGPRGAGAQVVNRFRCGYSMDLWIRHYGTKEVEMKLPGGRTAYRVEPVIDTVPAYRILDLARARPASDEEAFELARERERLTRFLSGRIAFVGATALGLVDTRANPLGEYRPGVENHAAVAANILEGRSLALAEREVIIRLLSQLLFVVLLAFLLPRMRPGAVIWFFVLLSGVAFFWCWVCFRAGSVVPPFGVLYPMLVFTVLGLAYWNRVENKEKAWLDGMFKRYVSPEYVEQIKANKGRLDLEGKEAVITPFFSDMAKFSTISEAFSAEGLFRFLGEYLGEMADILDEYRGTLDKFEGDAVVAFFGAPIRYDEHAAMACLASLKMQRRIVELERDWQTSDRYPELHQLARKVGHWFPIKVRIGLNTGPCATGHLGTAERGNYTMMGDTVNLAARLEAAGKQYGITLTISDDTYQQAKGVVVARPVDIVQVVGRTVGTRIYEVVSEHERLTPEQEEFLRAYQDGWDFYLDRQFEKARAAYEKAQALAPEDKVCEIFRGRCDRYLAEPPPEDWDGVWVLTEK